MDLLKKFGMEGKLTLITQVSLLNMILTRICMRRRYNIMVLMGAGQYTILKELQRYI